MRSFRKILGSDVSCLVVAALATVSREPGQALTGAAISGVTLCEGCRHRAIDIQRQATHPQLLPWVLVVLTPLTPLRGERSRSSKEEV